MQGPRFDTPPELGELLADEEPAATFATAERDAVVAGAPRNSSRSRALRRPGHGPGTRAGPGGMAPCPVRDDLGAGAVGTGGDYAQRR